MDPTDNDERVARTLHHAGAQPTGAPLTPPLVLSTAYALPGEPAGEYQYARWANPTWTALDSALAELEDAPVVTFPSGMAAIAAVFYGLLRAGDRVLLPADGYYTTRILAERFLAPLGVAFDLVATAALGTRSFGGYRLVMIETPSNPALDLADIRAVSASAKAAGAIVAVDNTMMTPLGQRPLELGADLLVSADTKAVNGHSDVLFGHVASREAALLDAVRDWRRIAGAIPGPFEAWLVHRGIETLELRFRRMGESALTLAQRLQAHRAVRAVVYPGLPEHPMHVLARQQMRGFGSIVGVTLADKDAAERFIGGCRFVRPATSFGGLHTSAERRARWGDQVPAGFVRLSVGCEPVEALWRDMQRSLDAL
jgi:cystathionine gamma-lyase